MFHFVTAVAILRGPAVIRCQTGWSKWHRHDPFCLLKRVF